MKYAVQHVSWHSSRYRPAKRKLNFKTEYYEKDRYLRERWNW